MAAVDCSYRRYASKMRYSCTRWQHLLLARLQNDILVDENPAAYFLVSTFQLYPLSFAESDSAIDEVPCTVVLLQPVCSQYQFS